MNHSIDLREVINQFPIGNITKLEQRCDALRPGDQDVNGPEIESNGAAAEQEKPHNPFPALYSQMQQMQERIDRLSGEKSVKTS